MSATTIVFEVITNKPNYALCVYLGYQKMAESQILFCVVSKNVGMSEIFEFYIYLMLCQTYQIGILFTQLNSDNLRLV